MSCFRFFTGSQQVQPDDPQEVFQRLQSGKVKTQTVIQHKGFFLPLRVSVEEGGQVKKTRLHPDKHTHSKHACTCVISAVSDGV